MNLFQFCSIVIEYYIFRFGIATFDYMTSFEHKAVYLYIIILDYLCERSQIILDYTSRVSMLIYLNTVEIYLIKKR